MPSALAHNDPGEQQQVKLWVSLLAILRRILISSSWRKTNSCSLQGVYQWNGGQLQTKAGLMWSWMLGAESGWSGVSYNSSTDSECTVLEASSVASDQDRFDTAYEAFRNLSAELYDIDT